MRINAIPADDKKREIKITITHGDEELYFGSDKLSSTEWSPDALYKEVNLYFESLSDEEADAVFEQYREASAALDYAIPAAYPTVLAGPIGKLADKYCSIERMRKFIPTLNIAIPNKIMETFDAAAMRKHRDQTYLKYEYAGLMCLMATFKCIYPIWNLAMVSAKLGEKRKDIFLFLDIMKTIGKTDLFVSEEMERLFVFTEIIYKDNIGNNEDTGVLEGISSDQIVAYIFSSLVIDRLMSLPIDIGEHNTHVVARCYHKIQQDCKTLPQNFSSKVIRREEVRSASEDSKINWLDIFTTKQKIPSSYYILNDKYLREIGELKYRLDASIPDDLIEECLRGFECLDQRSLPILGGRHPVPVHQVMVMWVLSDIIQIRAIPHVSRKSMLNAMAVVQAFLIHHNLKPAAALLSIYPTVQDCQIIHLEDVNKQLRSELARFCAYSVTGKHEGRLSERLANPFIVSIETLVKQFSDYKWELVTTKSMANRLGIGGKNQLIDPFVKDSLANMFILLMTKKFNGEYAVKSRWSEFIDSVHEDAAEFLNTIKRTGKVPKTRS